MSDAPKRKVILGTDSTKPSLIRAHYINPIYTKKFKTKSETLSHTPEERRNQLRKAKLNYLSKIGRKEKNGLPKHIRFENASQGEVFLIKQFKKDGTVAEVLVVYDGETPVELIGPDGKPVLESDGTPAYDVEYEFHKMTTGDPIVIRDSDLSKYYIYEYEPSEEKRQERAAFLKQLKDIAEGTIVPVAGAAVTGGGSAAAASGVSEWKLPGHEGGARKSRRHRKMRRQRKTRRAH